METSRIPIFGFIRLHAKGGCRATLWKEDATQKCWTSGEWRKLIDHESHGHGLHALRSRIEDFRLAISDSLGKEGIDSVGALRSLLLSERVSLSIENWLRDGGWVHILTGSGMHLLVFQVWIEKIIIRVGEFFEWNPIHAVSIARFIKWGSFLFFWAMTGFRAGLLRVLFIQALKDRFSHQGKAVSGLKLLILSCVLDAISAFILSIGNPNDPGDFGAGRGHYFLALYGGAFGYAIAKARKESALKVHFSLAFYSWLPTAVLDLLLEGKISYSIPVFSMISIPILTGLVLPFSLLMIPGVFSSHALSIKCFEWISALWNTVLRKGADFTHAYGLYREVKLSQAISALGIGILFSLIHYRFKKREGNQRRRRPPSTTKTSPVIHEASSLRKKRIADATSWGSPTRPIGKAEPRRA